MSDEESSTPFLLRPVERMGAAILGFLEVLGGVTRMGMEAVVTDTMMVGDEGRRRVAASILGVAGVEVAAAGSWA